MSEVVTGEAVALELRLAKLPSRLVAAVLDVALQITVLYAAVILGAVVLRGADSGLAAAATVIVIVVIFLGYPITMETLTRGRTLGKMVMGIRVVRDDGGPIGFRQALVRGLFAGLVEKPGLLFGVTAPVGVLVMLINSKGKRIGDLTAGTVVLQERVPAPRINYYAEMPPPLAGWAMTLELTGVDDGLALSVRQFLSRLPQLDARARATLGDRLSGAVAAATTPPPPAGTPGWAYLTAVLAERRRREEIRLARLRPAGPAAPPPYQQPPYQQPPYQRPPFQPALDQPAHDQPAPYQQAAYRPAPASAATPPDNPFAPPG